jgi:CBS domain containing-hemolysin-like protein
LPVPESTTVSLGGRRLTETLVRLTAADGLILVSGFLVTTESALGRLGQHSREELEGSARLQRAWAMTEQLEIYLTGCHIGITASSILLGLEAEEDGGPITSFLELRQGLRDLLGRGEALDRFQEARQEPAFAMEGDRVAGILTSTDALDAIAAAPRDPFD